MKKGKSKEQRASPSSPELNFVTLQKGKRGKEEENELASLRSSPMGNLGERRKQRTEGRVTSFVLLTVPRPAKPVHFRSDYALRCST
jgi:hypothetical protein